jgi:hypothetical protein
MGKVKGGGGNCVSESYTNVKALQCCELVKNLHIPKNAGTLE